jgi:hypothetical protein
MPSQERGEQLQGQQPGGAAKPPTIADLIAAAAEALREPKGGVATQGATPGAASEAKRKHGGFSYNYNKTAVPAYSSSGAFNTSRALSLANYTLKAITGCSLAQTLLGQCHSPPPPARPPAPPRPPNPPPAPPSPPPPPPSFTYMETEVKNGGWCCTTNCAASRRQAGIWLMP